MKCINCYREIEDNLKFCSFCGAKQPTDRAAYEREHPELVNARSEEENKLNDTSVVSIQELQPLAENDTGNENKGNYEHIVSLREDEIAQLQSQIWQLKRGRSGATWAAVIAAAVALFAIVMWANAPQQPKRAADSFGEVSDSVSTTQSEEINEPIEFDDFTYYGPTVDGKPNGYGLAVYRPNDPDDRKFYVGNFVNGKRQGDDAMLMFKNGDYFYGKLSDSFFNEGILYLKSDDSHFEGSFVDNNPYTGTWYKHKQIKKINEGN